MNLFTNCNFIKSLIYLCIYLGSINFCLANNCPQIDFDHNTCSNIAQYTINNYDIVGEAKWTVQGGRIIKVGDRTINQFAGEYVSWEYGYVADFKVRMVSFNRKEKGAIEYFDEHYQFWRFDERDEELSVGIAPNIAKNITVEWDPNATYKSIKLEAGSLSLFGGCSSSTREYQINIPQPIGSWYLNTSKTNLICNENIVIDGAPYGYNYYWSIDGAEISNNWGTGVNISRFTKTGPITAYCRISNDCYTSTRSILLNITPPNYGEVQQNGVNVSGANANYVVPNCDGNFWLGIPTWVSNYCTYTWELPLGYSPDANVYTINRVSGLNLLNVSGKLPDNALTDFVGKVTITGLCGDPVVKTFVIKPTLKPTIDPDFYSCANTVNIKVNNPNASSNINPWVTSSTSGTWGNFSNNTPISTVFTASGPGIYQVNVGLNDASNCSVNLKTTIHVGNVGFTGVNNNAVNGWQAGVLSDNRMRVGSNLVAYGNVIYFEGRDGKFYYYNFDNALQKWVINQVPGLTNVAIPAYGSFNKINFVTLNNTPYICYADNTGRFMKLNLLTNGVNDAIDTRTILLSNNNSFIAQNGEIYGIDNQGFLQTNTVNSYVLNSNVDFKNSIPNKGLIYVLNNNLFASVNNQQLTFTNDVTPNSDVVYYNGYLYYSKGAVGSANLYRMDMNAVNNVETITTTNNLSGKFSINFSSGVIYYGVLVGNAIPFTTYTVASGTYRSANIYQAHQVNGAWLFNRATAITPVEGADMLIHSPIYVGNHLIYIGAGHNSTIGGSFELEVWNLFYESSCAPSLQRTAMISNTETSTEVVDTVVDVYPNPFVNDLTIQSNSSDASNTMEVKVYDATGKLVFNQTVNNTQSINTDKWVSGVYIVKIIQGNQVINKTLIKVN